MKTVLEFDPKRDILRAVPDMSVDLAGAIESGVVLDTGMIAEHNDIDNPSSIIGRVHDVFDAFEAQKTILAAGREAAAAAKVAAASATPAATASAE